MDPLLFVGLVIMPFAVVWSIRRQIRNERERAARTIYVVHKRQSRRRA